MILLSSLRREAGLLLRDRAVIFWMVLILTLSMLAVWSGIAEVRHQDATIEQLLESDRTDRLAELARQEDWGGAAYYGFHLTYDPPSSFAFAAMGQRDIEPWKHRVRMLALEGQIHEHDAGNPALALTGRFDFAFLAVFILPLVLIVVLHDLRASERVAGRHDLLVATSGGSRALWWPRAILRGLGLYLCVIVPLLVAGLAMATPLQTLLAASAMVLAYTIFWLVLSFAFAAWNQSSVVILAALTGVWMLLAVIIPAGGRAAIDQLVPVPSGADIIMTQREAVNDAWDLPKPATMDAFLETHPEWSAYAVIERPFEWKWYYAFQQVGDQKAAALSEAYRNGRTERDRYAAKLALIAPPALLERSLQRLAGTDVRAAIEYEAEVRAFHAELRAFFYPKLFRDEPFEAAALDALPAFNAEPER